jgi:hypothetical protein
MYRITETMEIELMQGSLNSSMGEHLVANNKLAYSGHQTPPITPDGSPSGAPAAREAESDPQLCDLRALRGSFFSRVIRLPAIASAQARRAGAFREAEPMPKNSNLCVLCGLRGEL